MFKSFMGNNNNLLLDKINSILKNIKYPGFSRDIVSFGMVKNISMQDNTINISLQINSNNEENLLKLKNLIEEKLRLIGVNKVNIQFHKNAEKSDPSQHNQNSMNQQSIPNVKNIIAIGSGKGGVGKSTIAINVAASISKEYRVGLLDLDIYGPSLPMLVGMNTQPKTKDNNKLIPLEKYNMRLMSFGFINAQNEPTIWRGPMVARMTQQFFKDVEWGNLDFLIIDLPPGTGDIQLTLVQHLALTGAIIVTTPQKLALLDVKKSADMFNKVNTPILGIIENMTHFMCPQCNEKTKMFPGEGGSEESSRLNVPLLGRIYFSPEMTESTENGIPYVLNHKNSPITIEYNNITSQIYKLCGASINNNI